MAPADRHTGNAFDKYGSANPIARRLVGGFLRELDELIDRTRPSDILDVGCGEGIVSARMARRSGARVLGLDRADPVLEVPWARLRGPDLAFTIGDAHHLPFPDASWDVTAAIEVLEQVEHPDRALAELCRVAQRAVIVSVPREPVWRTLNVARGAYLRRLGNPPGHIAWFSRRKFLALCEQAGDVVAAPAPFPWTMVLLRPRRR